MRFIVNLPREELESVERICFQVEEAQWFYEDFVRPLDPTLPSLSLRQFCLKIFQHCQLFSAYDAALHSKAFSEFLAYKTRVPVRGAIMLNPDMTEVVLVKGWKKGANWSFPRGKINKDESDIDCAIREVYEETGYNIREAGLVPDEEDAKFIEVTMREQHMKLYVFAGVPSTAVFEPRTRKEISKIEWYKLSELPTIKKTKQQQHEELATNANKFYMVAPFLHPLKKIISLLRKRDTSNQVQPNEPHHATTHEAPTFQGSSSKIAASDDMSRLMSQLKQSEQASRENNLPEVSDPVEAAKNASIQLKTLLKLPQQNTQNPRQEQNATPLELRANAMLSLLRSGPNNLPTRSPPNSTTVPSDQLGERHQRVDQQRDRSTFAPNNRHDPSITFPSQPNHDLANSMPPLMKPSDRVNQFSSVPNIVGSQPHTLGSKAQTDFGPQGQQAFSTSSASHPPTIARGLTHESFPAMATTSNRPPPKLNSHSSALLSLFMSDTVPASASLPKSQKSNLSPQTPSLGSSGPTLPGMLNFQHTNYPGPIHSSSSISPDDHIAPNPTENGSRVLPKRSGQQETLLSLFRGSSEPVKPLQSSGRLTSPVELAASSSPRHSIQASEAQEAAGLTPSTPAPRQNEHFNPQIKPGVITGMKKPAQSAKITEQANVPQFDEIMQKTHANASSKKDPPKANGDSTASFHPVTILTRPDRKTEVSPEPRVEPARSRKSKQGPAGADVHHVEPQSNGSRPAFHPQILKRPTNVVPPRSSTLPVISKDQPGNGSHPLRSQGHVDTSTSTQGLQEPISAQDVHVGGLFSGPTRERSIPSLVSNRSSPIDLSRSRLGSLASFAGKSSPDRGPNQKTTSSAADKSFLLGFLEGVAKEGRTGSRT